MPVRSGELLTWNVLAMSQGSESAEAYVGGVPLCLTSINTVLSIQLTAAMQTVIMFPHKTRLSLITALCIIFIGAVWII